MISVFLLLGWLTAAFAISADQADVKYWQTNHAVNGTYTTNTYAQAIDYGKTHPNRDGGSWAGWCASLMVRAGDLPSPCETAIDCYYRSTVISTDVMAAPSGAFHWWDVGTDGHVAMATDHGWAMMASCRVTELWGDCIGVTSLPEYTAATGARYLGWSYDYNGAEIADVHQH